MRTLGCTLVALFCVDASAAELTCEELTQMAQIGLPDAAIQEALSGNFVRPDVPDCLAENGLSDSVVESARQIVDDPPVEMVPETEVMPAEEDPARRSINPDALAEQALNARARFEVQNPKGCSVTEVLLSAPHPSSAALWGLTVGFGGGSFYTKRPGVGAVHAAAEVGLWSYARWGKSPDPTQRFVLPALGILTLRIVDAIGSSSRARTQLKEMTAHCP